MATHASTVYHRTSLLHNPMPLSFYIYAQRLEKIVYCSGEQFHSVQYCMLEQYASEFSSKSGPELRVCGVVGCWKEFQFDRTDWTWSESYSSKVLFHHLLHMALSPPPPPN